MTQMGASGMFRQALRVSESGCFVPCVGGFDGVAFEGVLCTVRGVAVLVGVFVVDMFAALVGVEGAAARADRGSLGRRRGDEVSWRFCSRYARSFLYTRGGHGGFPRSGGSLSTRLRLRVGQRQQILAHKTRSAIPLASNLCASPRSGNLLFGFEAGGVTPRLGKERSR